MANTENRDPDDQQVQPTVPERQHNMEHNNNDEKNGKFEGIKQHTNRFSIRGSERLRSLKSWRHLDGHTRAGRPNSDPAP